jgi:hypothetical protein
MRTTITLEAETEALIKKAMDERGLSFKEVVNEAIKRGLQPSARPRVTLPSFNMGPPLVNLDKATQLAGELEDEEIVRKMSMGK